MKLILASNNKKKLKEMDAILSREGHEVIAMGEIGIDVAPEETGETFEENAVIKARAAMEASGMVSIADDSGLEGTALGGAPGVYSARYCEGTDEDRTNLLLKNMEGRTDRSARFVSAIACVFPNGDEIVVRGERGGEILHAPRGAGGFGYDPVFFDPAEGCTFAELDSERKNMISHRASAMEAFCRELKNKLNGGI